MSLSLALLDGQGPLDAGDLARAGAPLGDDPAASVDEVLSECAELLRDDPGLAGRVLSRVRNSLGAIGAPELEPNVAYLLAQVRVFEGRLADALVLIDESRQGHLANGDRVQAVRTNLGRTNVLNEMGRHEEALEASAEVLAVIGDGRTLVADTARHRMAALAHMNVGVCHEYAGRFQAALAAFADAEAAFTSLDDPTGMVEVVHNRAYVLMAVGRFAEAAETLQRAAELFDQGGMRQRLALTLVGVARCHIEMGEHADALAVLERAGEIFEEIEADYTHYDHAAARAEAYMSLNLLREAVDAYREIDKWASGADFPVEQARTSYGLGVALGRLGDREGTAQLERAVAGFRALGHGGWTARALIALGSLWARSGDTALAATHLAQAESVAAEGAAPVEALRARLALSSLALSSLAQSSLAGATSDGRWRVLYDEAVSLGVGPLISVAAHGAGREELRRGRIANARRYLTESADLVERQRTALGHEALLIAFGLDHDDLLADRVRLELADPEGGAAAALAVADAGKSRSLNDLARGSCRRGTVASDDVERDGLERDLHAIYRQMFEASGDTAAFERCRRRAGELEGRLRLLQLGSRRAEGVVAGPGPSIGREIAPGQTSPVTTLAYACLGDEIVAFVTAGDDTSAIPLAMRADEVRELAARLDAQHARLRLGTEFIERHVVKLTQACRAVLGRLYDGLIGPLMVLLGDDADALHEPTGTMGGRPLLVVPHGPLHAIPFHALWDGTAYMLDRWAISYAPSLAVFDQCSASLRAPIADALVVGLTDELAPLAATEAAAVAAMASVAGGRLLTDADATVDAVAASVHGRSLVHVATHAWHRADNPMFSAVRFADRWLTAAEVLDRLSFDGATVVLSACDTGRSATIGGDELLGLARGFLGAGAASLVVSLWPTVDEATTELMQVFHAELPRLGAANALRVAQRVLKESRPHPSVWAPFVLLGAR